MSKGSPDVLANKISQKLAHYVASILGLNDPLEIRIMKYCFLCDILDNMDLTHFQAIKLFAGGVAAWKEAQAPNLRQAVTSCGTFELEAK